MVDGTIRLATRESDLALEQASTVSRRLESAGYETELVTMRTTGDEVRDELIHRLGKTGAFVRSLDETVLNGEVDGAIHSMKDMPTERPDELVVAGVPERAVAYDVLVTPNGSTLGNLPDEATVGTSSLRREAQLTHHRSDLEVAPLRGNVDTRVEKLLAPTVQRAERRGDPEGTLSAIEQEALEREIETEYDGIVLAAAGLQRSDLWDYVAVDKLPVESFVPSAGQGAIAVTTRNETAAHRVITDVLDHEQTRIETGVERTILAELGGGCIAPIGVFASVSDREITVQAQVFDTTGEGQPVDQRTSLPRDVHLEAAKEFAAALDASGAGDLIDTARAVSDT